MLVRLISVFIFSIVFVACTEGDDHGQVLNSVAADQTKMLNAITEVSDQLSNLKEKIVAIEKTNTALATTVTTVASTQKQMNQKMVALAAANANPPAKKQEENTNKVYDIEIGNSITFGPKNAAVTLIKWLDFQCPFCAKSVPLVDQVLQKYPKDVKLVLKNFPLPFHKEAKKASRYAIAAHKQGKYMEMYRKIFTDFRKLKGNADYPLEIAKELGLDVDKLKKDFENAETEKMVDKEMEQMKTSGIPRMSVPKFLINGKEPQGRNFAVWSKIIDAEIAKAKTKAAQAPTKTVK